MTRSKAQPRRAPPQATKPKAKAIEERPEVSQRPTFNKLLSFALKLDTTHPFLGERGLSEDTIKSFGLGVADRGLMKGRLAIPIHNGSGDLVAYAGHWAAKDTPRDVPKYLLPPGFNKQIELFNLNRLPRGCEHVVIVESYFSVFKLHALGIPVVSTMGHEVSDAHCTLLRERGIEMVALLFDGDEAGRQGTANGVPLLARHFFVYAPPVPDGFKPHKASEEEIAFLLKQ